MTVKLETTYSLRNWKRLLQRYSRSVLKSMLQGTGKWEWIGHVRTRQLEDTFETGLQDGTLVRVKVKTEIVVTPISTTQPVTSHSSSPTKHAVSVRTTGPFTQRQPLDKEALHDLLWRKEFP